MQLNLYKRTLLNVLTETISIEIVLDNFDETKSSNVQRISLTPVCKKFEERNKRRLPSVFWQGNVAKLWVSCSDPDWQCSERFLVYFWVQNWSYPHEISHNCKKLQTKSTNPVKSARSTLWAWFYSDLKILQKVCTQITRISHNLRISDLAFRSRLKFRNIYFTCFIVVLGTIVDDLCIHA